jgi:putative transposase
MTTPSGRRAALGFLTCRGISQRKACRYWGLSRRVSSYRPRQADKDQAVAQRLLEASPRSNQAAIRR